MKTLVSILFTAVLTLSTNSQAALIDILTPNLAGDSWEISADAGDITIEKNDSLYSTQITGWADGQLFEHDYLMSGVGQSLINFSSAVSNTGNPGPNSAMTYQAYSLVGTTYGTGSAAWTSIGAGAASIDNATSNLTFNMLAGTEYVIRIAGITNDASVSDYDIQMSAVPVPAAGLLFGSALLGMLGFKRRKSTKGNAIAA